MAALELNKIIDSLNEAFSGGGRKIIFWYDDNGSFAEDIDEIVLDNAKVLKLERAEDKKHGGYMYTNQFYTKYYLEKVDPNGNYLVYAPFPQPAPEENHLEDIRNYSRTFYADRLSMICSELGIGEDGRQAVIKCGKFFENKNRVTAFRELDIDKFTEDNIYTGIMCVICRATVLSFDEVIRTVLCGDLDDNKYLSEFETYNVLDFFWERIAEYFGCSGEEPSLKKLTAELFISYLSKTVHKELPQSYQRFLTYKTGSIQAFLENMMNSSVYSKRFDELSAFVYEEMNGAALLGALSVDSIIDSSAFEGIDTAIIKYLTERLAAEDVGASVDGKSIPEVCDLRIKKHFGSKYAAEYTMLSNAWYIISNSRQSFPGEIKTLAEQYCGCYYKIDTSYRNFYSSFDRIENNGGFDELRRLVENIYTNEYLANVTLNWTKAFADSNGKTTLPYQLDFCKDTIDKIKERVAVIISDGMRYEVGMSLYERLMSDEKCKVTISAMQSVLPSVTSFGLAALLPHKNLEIKEDCSVLIDGCPCDKTEQKDKILKAYVPESVCIQFDAVKKMSKTEKSDLTKGKSVIYIYHNQIDTRGEKAASEDEVFAACDEAASEIADIIRKLTSANVTRFIITSDHGFIYKRDKISESGKIDDISKYSSYAGKRYAITDEAIRIEGVGGTGMDKIYFGSDSRTVSYPIGSDVFKSQGGGSNYVHGGCSPQEMIIPLIDVKTDKNKVETTFAQIVLVSLQPKITNLVTRLDFLQSQPVSDIVKAAEYSVCLVAENGDKISNEHICIADSTDSDSQKRMFSLKFSLINKTYSPADKYYLVIRNTKSGLETFRQPFTVDIAFSGDYGFMF